MPEPAGTANPFDDALRAEYRALAGSIAQQRERAERLQTLADRAHSQAEADEHALRELGSVLGLDPQMCLESLDERLRGRRLQEIAVQVLATRSHAGAPVHYKEWYALLKEAGYSVAGKDPLATFLAAISRSPHVKGIGRRTGLYMLVGGASAEEPGQLSETDAAHPAAA